MAEAITSSGQVFIIKSREYINDMFTKMLDKDMNYAMYSDTDSVVGDTLVYANGKQITIAELYEMCSDTFVKKDDNKKSFVKPVDCITSLAFDLASDSIVEKPIKYVMKHKVKKRLFRLTVNSKYVTVTEDHSLIVYRDGNYVEVSPKHLKSGDKLLYIKTQQPVSLYEETSTNTKATS